MLPVLLTLALAAVDFSRVLGLSAELSNAVRAGAESGATHRPTSRTFATWSTRVRTVVQEELLDANEFDLQKVALNVALPTDAQGYQQVQVTATYPFRTIVSWPLIPSQVTLRSQVTMRQYR